MTENPEAQRLVDRHAQLLKMFIKSADVSVRGLERRLAIGPGSLNRIFTGRNELKVRHIMMILDELGVEPSEFYRCLAREEDPARTPAEALAEVLAAAARKPSHSDDDLEYRMRQIFDRLVAERNAGTKSTRKSKAKRRENSRRTVKSKPAALAQRTSA
jgi:hypothetical protein